MHGNGFRNLSGLRFARWTVIAFSHTSANRQAMWNCECACGHKKIVNGSSLIQGDSTSCGCHKIEVAGRQNITHGEGNHSTPEYRIWTGMNRRCSTPSVRAWPNYGGRGICVCDQWQHSYETFLRDMGRRPSPGHSIDRINNDGNYSPDNCRWATKREQMLNTRRTAFIDGCPLHALSAESGIPQRVLYKRLFVHEWPLARALSKPLRQRRIA